MTFSWGSASRPKRNTTSGEHNNVGAARPDDGCTLRARPKRSARFASLQYGTKRRGCTSRVKVD
jgi:hypothetical protein